MCAGACPRLSLQGLFKEVENRKFPLSLPKKKEDGYKNVLLFPCGKSQKRVRNSRIYEKETIPKKFIEKTSSVTIAATKTSYTIDVKTKKGGADVSRRKKASVLVCVTGQRDCGRLIVAGKELAEKEGLSLQVLCVQPMNHGYCVKSDEMEYLYQVTRDAGAEMTIFFQDDAPLIAAGFAKQVKAKHIVTGMPDGRANGFVQTVHYLIPKVPISMVAEDSTIYHIYPSFGIQRRQVPAMG